MVEIADTISETLSSLGLLGANGSDLIRLTESGVSSANYRQLIITICDQLKRFLTLEETVRETDDIAMFSLELAGFLRELRCPVATLTNLDVEDRFLDCATSLQLLAYLASELQAVRLIARNNPEVLKKTAAAPQTSGNGGINAFWLQLLCKALGFPKPPPTISPQELCTKLESRISEVVSTWPPEILSKPLLNCQLSSQQWASLNSLNEIFTDEYAIRREMLLTRLDVTVRSFGWGDRTKGTEIEKVYLPLRQAMKVRTGLGVASILAAREDLILIRKTCDLSLRERTKCDVNKAKMGAVPDRGGRANEYDAPAPEMPQWQKRQAGGDGGRGGGRGGRGGGGGHGGHRGHGGQGNVFDRLDGGRPHTAGGPVGYAQGYQEPQGAYYQQQQQYQANNYYQGQPQFQGQQFRPQSNFDMYGGFGGDDRQERSHSGRGRGSHRGGRY